MWHDKLCMPLKFLVSGLVLVCLRFDPKMSSCQTGANLRLVLMKGKGGIVTFKGLCLSKVVLSGP